MKSGSYYLYEYKNNQKSRNVGFLKFTQQSNCFSIQICARGLHVFQNDTLSLAALFSYEKQFSSCNISSVACENHAITCRLEIPTESVSENISLDQLIGFLLELPGGSYIAATEDSSLFTPALLAASVSLPAAESTQESKSKDTRPVLESVLEDTLIKDFELTSEPTAESSCTSEKPSFQKLTRKELTILPRQYWYLANNSFLLHGYYNYNHLLLIEEDGHFLLGVPGIYDKQEARAAELFGFPSFSGSYADQLQLTEEEIKMPGTFGHWFREIPK